MTNPNAIQKSQPAAVTSANAGCCGTESATQNSHDAQRWSYLPALDVWEREHEFVFEIDAPGVNPAEAEITVDQGVLHVHGPVAPRFGTTTRFLRQEYGIGDFDRNIPLGRLSELVDGNNAAAEYRDGVLTVRLPKIEQAKPKKISVNVV